MEPKRRENNPQTEMEREVKANTDGTRALENSA